VSLDAAHRQATDLRFEERFEDVVQLVGADDQLPRSGTSLGTSLGEPWKGLFVGGFFEEAGGLPAEAIEDPIVPPMRLPTRRSGAVARAPARGVAAAGRSRSSGTTTGS